MVVNDTSQAPVDVVDRLLWRDAQQMLLRHAANAEGSCGWCGRQWPCAARRLAERAESAAFRPWNEGWTVRGDLHSLRSMPSWRADLAISALTRTPRHAAVAGSGA